jgi:hypothetical protein
MEIMFTLKKKKQQTKSIIINNERKTKNVMKRERKSGNKKIQDKFEIVKLCIFVFSHFFQISFCCIFIIFIWCLKTEMYFLLLFINNFNIEIMKTLYKIQ